MEITRGYNLTFSNFDIHLCASPYFKNYNTQQDPENVFVTGLGQLD